MKNKNVKMIGGALGAALVLIVGSNVLSEKPVISEARGVIHQPTPIATGMGEHENTSAVALAPDFTLTSLTGEQISLSDYRGVKPVVLDFFATWCPNCQRDMPRLSRMYETYKDDVEVIGIDLHENKATVQKFITERNILFPIVIDSDSVVSRAYGVRYTNYHVMINKDGSLAGVVPGDMSEASLQQLIATNQ